MKAKIKILHLEDMPDDASLVSRALKKGLIDAEIIVVDNRLDFEKALREFSPDLVLSDHSLPSFDSIEAFKIFKQSNLQIPFILVTATVSEDFAVRAIKSGVDDYILKDNLKRLPSAIENSLALYKTEREKQTILNRITDSVISVDNEWRYTFLNDAALATHSLGREETLGKVIWDVHPEMKGTIFWDKYHEAMGTQKVAEIESYYAPMNTWFHLKAFPSPEGLTIFYSDVTERKNTQAIIAQNEKRFRALIENSTDGLTVINANGIVVEMSPSGRKILGYAESEIVGKNRPDLIHPDDRDNVMNAFKEIIADPANIKMQEYRHKMPDGSYKWLECTFHNLLNEPNINAIVLNYRDITERKGLEDLLYKSNVLARIGSWKIDLVKGTVYWNDITREIHEASTGFVPDLATGINFYKEGRGRDLIIEKVKEAIEIGKPWDEELQIITAKNNERWIRTIGEAEFIDGKCVTIYGSFQDIDQRKKSEIKLAESENHLRTILSAEPECVKILNLKGELLSMNPAGLAMIEADNEEQVLGQKMEELVDSKYRAAFKRLTKEVFNGNSETLEFEVTGLKGSHRWLETHAVPMKTSNGKVTSLLGVTRDITERKQIEEQLKRNTLELERSNKELEQFAYIASHDLQEPLRMVGSYLQLIERRYKGKLDSDADEFIHYAVDGAARMKQLINDLLNYSRLNKAVDHSMVDLNEVMHIVRQNISISLTENNAVLTASALPVIDAHETQMIQLFQNLISNSLKFRQKEIHPVIRVQAEKKNDQWLFSVSDNGIGVEKEYADQIFIIFKKLHTRDKYSGTGIGLAVAKKIVERHGGKLWFESAIGKGTTFFFTLNPKS